MANVNNENSVHLFRLQTLIIDGGLLVLRHILDCKLQVQNISLVNCLGQERPTITRLKGQKKITQVQYDLLYPQGGHPPSTVDFDITLTICLLRNLKPCGLNRNFNWSIAPQPGDTCIEADLYRLKQYRNEVAHISKTTGIDVNEFGLKWTEIEQILTRLNSSVQNPIPNLQQTIDEFKTSSLDPEAEEKIDKAIKEWCEMEKRLEEDVEKIKTDIKEFTERASEQADLIKKTQSRVTALESHIPKAQKDETQGMNVCKYCGEFFSNNSTLRQHEMRHRQEGKYSCELCAQVFFSKYHFDTHMRRHSDDRPFVCVKCGKSFKTDHDLKRHREREEGPKKYTCSLCTSKFLYENERKDHEDKHKGQFQHKCDAPGCGKSFRYKTNLYRHKKIHEGTDFTCDHCGKVFRSKPSLVNHLRYVTRECVKCPICRKTFSCKQTLEKHTKNKH